MDGVTLNGTIEKVSDGDTLRITAAERLWKVRVLGLDTEESNANPHKPVTKWGKAASVYTKSILPVGTPVTIEFPGTEPPLVDDEINRRYLDNFERPLAFVHLSEPVDGITDFSELMIRKGYSPYFVKYGRATFSGHDKRYALAERHAQVDDIGVWNQFASNDAMRPEDAPRNYARLMVWWELRARVIDLYRMARSNDPTMPLFNTRLDYETLVHKAEARETVTVFMEMKEGTTVGGLHHVIKSGSLAQPFQLFLPHEERDEIVAIKRLMANRYIADGEDHPRRNYAYATGALKLFRGAPEMTVTSIDQVADTPPAAVC
jgi:micrococcal nuclease